MSLMSISPALTLPTHALSASYRIFITKIHSDSSHTCIHDSQNQRCTRRYDESQTVVFALTTQLHHVRTFSLTDTLDGDGSNTYPQIPPRHVAGRSTPACSAASSMYICCRRVQTKPHDKPVVVAVTKTFTRYLIFARRTHE